MSRYKRISTRKLVFNENNLNEIKQKISNGQSKRSIAKEMGINESTLRKRLKSGNVPESLGRFSCDIPSEMETTLAKQVKELDSMFFGLTKKDLQRAAYKFAEVSKIKHRFNNEKQMAGESWVKGFCQRHKIVLRQPEKCSLARTMGFNKQQVLRFYENLKSILEKKEYAPSSIYNMDETGLSTVPNKLPKVLSSKGKRVVGKVVSAERGQLVTAVCCLSASGSYIPPGMIFPRKRMKDELFINAPYGTLKMISDSGYMNTELFYKWLVHFKTYAKPSADNPVLLILDNHSSHRDLEAIRYCRENNIELLSLPPHASHRMQPLDVGFFGPLKSAYSRECDKWMVNHPGKVITQMQVSALFQQAYSSVANIQKAENSFRATGIFPFNPEQFTDADFGPSTVTDLPLSQSSITDEDENFSLNCSKEIIHSTIPSQATPPSNIIDLDIVCEDGFVITNDVLENDFNISNILPLPRIEENNRRKTKSQRSEILSSTPFKNELEEKESTKLKEQQKKEERVKKKLQISAKRNSRNEKEKCESQDATCPGCQNLYSKSEAGEDWIACSECEKWWHESCTTYVTGVFICFNCEK